MEDVLVKIDKFIFPTDFIVLDMEEDSEMPLSLGKPFLATGRALINVQQGELMLRVHDEKVIFKVFEAMKHSMENEKSMRIDVIDPLTKETFKQEVMPCSLKATLVNCKMLEEEHEEGNPSVVEYVKFSRVLPLITHSKQRMKKILMAKEVMKEDPPKLQLKSSPPTFESAFLGGMVCRSQIVHG